MWRSAIGHGASASSSACLCARLRSREAHHAGVILTLQPVSSMKMTLES
ncbi:MAG: hypothetical protein IT382_22230 [Deltaproteobacteria bacterium]|nr:hypothetical protein [Deltaproteobacteria bacterium]